MRMPAEVITSLSHEKKKQLYIRFVGNRYRMNSPQLSHTRAFTISFLCVFVDWMGEKTCAKKNEIIILQFSRYFWLSHCFCHRETAPIIIIIYGCTVNVLCIFIIQFNDIPQTKLTKELISSTSSSSSSSCEFVCIVLWKEMNSKDIAVNDNRVCGSWYWQIDARSSTYVPMIIGIHSWMKPVGMLSLLTELVCFGSALTK